MRACVRSREREAGEKKRAIIKYFANVENAFLLQDRNKEIIKFVAEQQSPIWHLMTHNMLARQGKALMVPANS